MRRYLGSSKFPVEPPITELTELTDNDLNALRYVAGYIPWKLRQKFIKVTCQHPNRKAFLVCLESMSENARGQ